MSVRSKNKRAVIDSKHCVACGCCVSACPISAIQICHGSFAEVDGTKCIGCGRCAKACPASVIQIEVSA